MTDRFHLVPAQRPARPGDDPVRARIETAISAVQAGENLVLVDTEDPNDDGELLLAAVHATPHRLAFMMRHTSGILCVPMPAADLDRLQLPPMVAVNENPKGAGYAVSVNAANGISSGISAADRARTISLLANPRTRPADLTRPGHVFPLRAVDGGVLRRRGHTEAAVDLMRLAGLPPVAVICELVGLDGTALRGADLRAFADEHGLVTVATPDLIAYRQATERMVEFKAASRMPTEYGVFRAHGFRSVLDGREHLALVMGDVDDTWPPSTPTLVAVHTECLMGNVFGSESCCCGRQLEHALKMVAAVGRGVVLYLRGRADPHSDIDTRDFGLGAQILSDLGVRRMRLLVPDDVSGADLVGHGLEIGMEIVDTVSLPA